MSRVETTIEFDQYVGERGAYHVAVKRGHHTTVLPLDFATENAARMVAEAIGRALAVDGP